MAEILNVKVNGQWVGIPALKGKKGDPGNLAWLELSSVNWVQDGTVYKYVISGNHCIVSVYKGTENNKELVENIDVAVINGINYLTSQEPFDGYAMVATASNATPASVYTHEQGVSSAQWVINHNLNTYPSVTVVDTSGSTIIYDLTYNNSNTITLDFKSAFKGTAYLNYTR